MKEGIKYLFVVLLIILGLMLNHFDVAINNNLRFGSVGSWILLIAFIVLFIAVLRRLAEKKLTISKKTKMISWKASQVTYMVFMIVAVLLLVLDTVLGPLDIPTRTILNCMVLLLLLTHLISFKVFSKRI